MLCALCSEKVLAQTITRILCEMCKRHKHVPTTGRKICEECSEINGRCARCLKIIDGNINVDVVHDHEH